MLYETLRAAARVALRWYYGDVIVQGRERIPTDGPVLVVANHPNALVDAMLVATSIRRRILITAKATLFEHSLLGPFLNLVGVVPLQRAQDVRAAARDGSAVSRNQGAIDRVTRSFRENGVVLIFPEGISHDQPMLAPLKTGAARIALRARQAGTHMLLLPVGLVFEEKERPRSRVLVRIGEPLDLDAWCAEHPSETAAALTRELDGRLRHVTLNFASDQRARQAVSIARALAMITQEPSGLGSPRSYESEAEIAARVGAATEALEGSLPALRASVEDFVSRLESLEGRLASRGITLSEVKVSVRAGPGAYFVAREGLIAALALPIAALGRITHWLPIRIARLTAMRSLRTDPSRDQPAMRTMVLGLATVLAWYALQALAVAYWAGGTLAALWIAGIFVAANVDLLVSDRVAGVHRRARTYLVLRADPAFRTSVLREIDMLLADALALESELVQGTRQSSPT